nr:T9SS type A sorting domain-containing protein [Chitinophagaceae bacterium]
ISFYNGSFFEEINTKDFVPGVYFIKIQSGNKVISVKKVIK